MKRIFAALLFSGFAVAVCYAVPYGSGPSPNQVELTTKKVFELPMAELPQEIIVPEAPEVVYDLIVSEERQSTKIVHPQSNSPPEVTKHFAYSMAKW